MSNHLPEKLNLWDRLFNRYKKTIHARGSEQWFKSCGYTGLRIPGSEFQRNYVEYLIIDRLTGSEKIEKIYLK
jgi:hypothetical protein